ncbi:MAG: hypothetical protein HY081_08335 [Gammaproteobacteria bacterium]|nr:hypothetical protein [Gammaproteobacteria bacterium]
MSLETIVVLLLVWTVAGLFAAIAFGKVIQDPDVSPDQQEPIPSSSGSLKYLRRNKRKSSAPVEHTSRVRHTGMKRATG